MKGNDTIEESTVGLSALAQAASAGVGFATLISPGGEGFEDDQIERLFARYARANRHHLFQPFIDRLVIEQTIDDDHDVADFCSTLERIGPRLLRLASAYTTVFCCRLVWSQFSDEGLSRIAAALERFGVREMELVFAYPEPPPSPENLARQRRALSGFLARWRHSQLQISMLKTPLCFGAPGDFRAFLGAEARATLGDIERALRRLRDLDKDTHDYLPVCRACRRRAACYSTSDIGAHPSYDAVLEPPAETTLVFAGASLAEEDRRSLPQDVVLVGPAAQGDFFMALLEGFTTILLIDGYFAERYSCTTLEIVMCLERGVNVFGAASMGALRGRELDGFGMRACGMVYDYLSSATLVPYHVVAQLYDDQDRALTDPLISVRYFLDLAVEETIVSRADAERLFTAADRIHYTQLTFEAWFHRLRLERSGDPQVIERLERWFREQGRARFEVKQLDARTLLQTYRAVIERDGADFVEQTFRRARADSEALLLRWQRWPEALPRGWDEPRDKRVLAGRECDLSETLANLEAFFASAPMVVADTSRYIDTRFHMFSIVFVPLYFLGYYLATSSGFGPDSRRALTAAYMELFERIGAYLFRMGRPRGGGRRHARLSGHESPWRSLWQFGELPVEQQREVERNPDLVPCSDIVTGKRGLLPRFFIAEVDSSGLAAGNTFLEAVTYGLFECIERHVHVFYGTRFLVTLLPSLALKLPRGDAQFEQVLRSARSIGMQTEFYYLPNTFHVPVVECHIRYGETIYVGLGCRFSLREAIARSFYEALNAIFVVIAGTRDDTTLSPSHPRVLDLLMSAKGPRHPADERRPMKLSATLAQLKQRVVGSGYPSILVVDVTPEQTGLVAVRVIVPGFEVPTCAGQRSPLFAEQAARVYDEACTFIMARRQRPKGSNRGKV